MTRFYYIILLVHFTYATTFRQQDFCKNDIDKVPIAYAPLHIVLQKTQFAASRRFQNIPQITSDSGKLPNTIVCTRTNQPLTIDTRWNCTSNTPFNRARVQWEGFHSKHDTQYFLKDSFSVHLHQTIYKEPQTLSTLEWCKCVFQTCLSILFLIGIFIIVAPILEECLPLIGMILGFGLLSSLCSSSNDDDDDDWYSGDGYSSIR